MRAALFAYSRKGCETAQKIREVLGAAECRAYGPDRIRQEGFRPLERPPQPFYGALFSWADAMIFVGACGIAVREIAPHVRDKRTDPAVVCVDEQGRFVIPLLSGHIGGANRLAERLAEGLDAVPVITTATDGRGLFSVDAWAAEQGLLLDSMAAAKAVSAAILEGNVPFCSDLPVSGPWPRGLVPGEEGELGICVTWRKKAPFRRTLRLIPRVVRLGIGCRRGTPAEAVRRAVEAVLEKNDIDIRAVRLAASIDLKAEEPGLLAYCQEMGWTPVFWSAGELRAVPGDFTGSSFVEQTVGVDNVCERAALLGAEHLVVRKTAVDGVTVAAAVERAEVCFG